MKRALFSRVASAAAAAVAFATLLWTGVDARADTDAQAQFDYGLSEMTAGRFATGCPALEMSFRADPRPGTLFTLAECQLKWGRTASALASYEQYLAVYERMSSDQKAKQGQRPSIAASQRGELVPTVPRLTVSLPAGDWPAAAVVMRDSMTLAGPLLGEAIAVDPGDHVVVVTLADGRSKQQHVTLANGERRVVVVELPSGPEPSAAVASPPQAPPVAPAAMAAEPSSHRVWIVVSAGLGVAGLAVAGVTGGLALADRSTASSDCTGAVCRTQAGADAGNTARTLANVETGAIVFAGTALVAAAILWLTEPSAHASTASARGFSFSPLDLGGMGARW